LISNLFEDNALGFLYAFEESADWAPFIFLRLFKLAHIYIQICTRHSGDMQGIKQRIFNRKSISLKIAQSRCWKLQASLERRTAKIRAETANKLKTKLKKS